MGQGVLEGKVALGEQPGLVEELRGLQVRQPAVQGLFGQLRNGLEQGKGHLRANDGGRLEEAFLLRRQPVDARRQYRLHGGRHLDGGEGLCQTVGAWHTNQHARLDQGAHALLQEEGIPLRTRDQEAFERLQAGVVPQQGLEECLGTRRGERVEPHLRIVRLTAPAVLVLRAVVDQQQEADRGQALDQAIQQGLGLGIDPVQVFKDQQQRLLLTLTQQQTLEGVERALPSLWGIKRQEGAVVRQGVQEPEQCRQRLLEGRVQRQHLPGDPGADGAGVVAVLDAGVALEEVDDREVGRGFAIRHRGALEHQPVLRAVGVHDLIHQPGLANPRFPDEGDHLAVPRPGLLQGLGQGIEFMLTAHKARQPPCGGHLQASAQGTGAEQFVGLHGLCQPLDRHGPQGLHLHQALHQTQRGGGQQDGARRRELFHARRQVHRLPDGGIVHVQVVADGPHHHLAGVQPYPCLERQALRATHLVAVAPQRRLHGQGGVAGPQGVVLMRNGGAKQGHNAIAQHLVHRALVAVHRVHHQMQGGVQELPGGFRVESLDEPCGVLEVGKQHGDLLALAFQVARAARIFSPRCAGMATGGACA